MARAALLPSWSERAITTISACRSVMRRVAAREWLSQVAAIWTSLCSVFSEWFGWLCNGRDQPEGRSALGRHVDLQPPSQGMQALPDAEQAKALRSPEVSFDGIPVEAATAIFNVHHQIGVLMRQDDLCFHASGVLDRIEKQLAYRLKKKYTEMLRCGENLPFGIHGDRQPVLIFEPFGEPLDYFGQRPLLENWRAQFVGHVS